MTAPTYTSRVMSAEEFEHYALRDDNADHILELIDGEMFIVPSNPFASKISALISYFIVDHIRKHGIGGHVTGEAGGYRVGGDRYAPDVAFVRAERQPEVSSEGYNTVPPDLAVEVEFPTSIKSQRRLEKKLAQYSGTGTTVWVVYPETREVEVHAPDGSERILGENDTLDGGEILPGFSLSVKEIFPEKLPERAE